ncbi:hypothetical protein D3C73_1354610 [compost metagenome]
MRLASPIAAPSLSLGNTRIIVFRNTGTSNPAPIPCIIRPLRIHAKSAEKPAISVPVVNAPTEAKNRALVEYFPIRNPVTGMTIPETRK